MATGEDVIKLVTLVTTLKEIVQHPEPPKQATLVEMLSTLKQLGIVAPRTREDESTMLEKLKLLKDALSLKYAHEVEGEEKDPLEMVQGVKTLITALRPFVESSPPSTRQMVLEAFGKYSGPLFETIRNLGRAKKLEVQNRMNDSP